eukprot:gene6400-12940_t
MIKKISSGGDTLIGRTHGKEEFEFITHFLPICFANDLPNITPFDDAIDNRTKFVSFDKEFVENPTNEFELKKDSNLENEIKSVVFKRVLVGLLIKEYKNFIDVGFEIEPNEIKNAKHTWVGDDNNVLKNILNEFEITNNLEDCVESSEIEKYPVSGKGLFAIDTKKAPNEVIFKKNSKIIEYKGNLITDEDKNDRYLDNTAPYTVQIKRDLNVDCGCKRGVGALANTRPHFNNSTLSVFRNKAFIKATRNIKNNEEIYLAYGRSYKQRDKDEYREYLNNKIKVQNYYKPIGETLWSQKQQELYPNGLITSQIPSLNNLLITQQTQKIYENTENPDVMMNKAELLLKKIAEPEFAKYIVDRLDSGELNYLVNFFPEIEREFRKNYPTGVGKDVFLYYIKDQFENLKGNIKENPNLINFSLNKRAKNEQEQKALNDAKRQEEYQKEIERLNQEYQKPFKEANKREMKRNIDENLLQYNPASNFDDDLFYDNIKAKADAQKRKLINHMKNQIFLNQASTPITPGTHNHTPAPSVHTPAPSVHTPASSIHNAASSVASSVHTPKHSQPTTPRDSPPTTVSNTPLAKPTLSLQTPKLASIDNPHLPIPRSDFIDLFYDSHGKLESTKDIKEQSKLLFQRMNIPDSEYNKIIQKSTGSTGRTKREDLYSNLRSWYDDYDPTKLGSGIRKKIKAIGEGYCE